MPKIRVSITIKFSRPRKRKPTGIDGTSLGLALKEMRLSHELTDVILVCEGGDVEAHRAVLAAKSPYFKKMFLSSFKESCVRRVNFSYVKASTMNTILDYIYLNTLESIAAESIDNLLKLHRSSHMFELKPLTNYCWQLIKSQINNENCVSIWNEILVYGEDKDVTDVLKFFLDNLQEIIERGKFPSLQPAQFTSLIKEMEKNSFPLDDFILDTFVHYNKIKEVKKEDLQSFLLHMNFDFISNEFLNQLMEDKDDLLDDTFYKQFFKEKFLPKLKTKEELIQGLEVKQKRKIRKRLETT